MSSIFFLTYLSKNSRKLLLRIPFFLLLYVMSLILICSSLHFSGSLPHLNVLTSVDGLKPVLSYLHYFHSRHICSHWHLAISLSNWTLWPDLALKPSWILRSRIFWVPFSWPFYTNVLLFWSIFNRFTFMWLLASHVPCLCNWTAQGISQ